MEINPPEYYNDTTEGEMHCVCQTCFEDDYCEYTYEWQCSECREKNNATG